MLLVFCEMREMSFFKRIKLIIFLSEKRHLAHLAESCLRGANLFFLGNNMRVVFCEMCEMSFFKKNTADYYLY